MPADLSPAGALFICLAALAAVCFILLLGVKTPDNNPNVW